jgi:hypothetical protein
MSTASGASGGNPQPQAENQPGDLGLSAGQWHDLAVAYNYGLIEPAEGTVEAEAFRLMDAYARQEATRAAQADNEPQAEA